MSVSSVIRPSSSATLSPSATSTSIISTSVASPISGTVTSITEGPELAAGAAGAAGAEGVEGVEGVEGAAVETGAEDTASSGAAEPASALLLAISSVNTKEPSDTLSPTATFKLTILPACGAGTSIVALSVSKVIRPSSSATVSPSCTSNSIISTSLASPISGTSTSITFEDAAGAEGAEGAASVVAVEALAAGAASASAASSTPPAANAFPNTSPSLILSPTLTLISFITPSKGIGISMLALSLSTVTIDASASTDSPSSTHTSMISTSSPPTSGTIISCKSAMIALPYA